jgi:hypothetical protein
MYRTLRSTFGVTLCLLALASPRLGAAEPPAPPLPTAQLVAVEGASHTYRLMDYDHRVITVTVPAQSLADIQTPTLDGTVQATVASIDLTTGRVKAATDAGQVLVLALPHAELGRLQRGDTVTLVVPHHARVAGSR